MEARRLYYKCYAINIPLNNQMVEFLEDVYLLPLKNPYTGYETNTTLSLIEHIYKNYAHILAIHMAVNNEHLCSPYTSE